VGLVPDGIAEAIDNARQVDEQLAASLEQISDAAEGLLKAGLTKRALVLLLDDLTSNAVGKQAIGEVLDALPRLRSFVSGSARR
jgi:methyl-accepting chemotaxis protein